jgi:3,4-dihydroxy-2-butanone 4-phosphate synthase
MALRIAEQGPFASVEAAIEDIRQGKFVVVVDAADRENEGDLTIAAQFATPEAINFMAKEGRGLVCLCLTEERCDELGLRMMTDRNETPFGTAFTVSIEAREGITTGISAHDRSRTIQVAIDPSKSSHDLVEPGHVFPLRARGGGVLQRAGQTEAAVDLAARGPDPGRGRLRSDEGRRHDGARPRPDSLLRAARDQAPHRRRPDRIPPQARATRRAGDDRAHAHRVR